MEKIVMVTEYPYHEPSGSTMRMKWELEALKRNGFSQISIIDKFNKNSIKPNDCLFHAQQLSGRFLKKKSYISDLHGIAFEEMWHKSFQYPLHSWKRWGFRTKSHLVKKMEENTWKNALHLICASDIIYDRVKNVQGATVVRNSVKIDDYPTTKGDELKVAVVGPFLPGTQNYQALDLIRYCVKNLTDIEFVFIGSTNEYFKENLKFSNSTFLGKVENYIETLSTCNVLLSPYPESSYLTACPTKMLEAGACQMTVVTNESGARGSPDDLFLVGKSKIDLVNKLLYLKDENTRKTYGKKIRSEIEKNYNSDVEIKKLIKLYRELLN
jgi:glycosyltransferase involved in cell wall biosynthesis